MRRLLWGVLIPFLAFVISSCDDGGGSGSRSKLSGKMGEILVISRLDLTHTALRDTLESVLRSEYPYIPQAEPSFSTIYITEKAFTNILMPFRTILMIHFHSDSVQPSLRIESDRWATGQRIVHLTGADQKSLAEYVSANQRSFYNTFERIEIQRLQHSNQYICEELITDTIRALFGVSLTVPQGYVLRRAAPDFQWYSIETPDISQGIVVYKYPNFGTPYATDTLLAHRNLFTHRYIPGPNPNTYMTIADVVPPELTYLKRGTDTVAYLRGFWEVYGHAMGGAFVSYSRLTKSGDSVVTTDGYIYAPRFKKRDYMRALEAILQSQFR